MAAVEAGGKHIKAVYEAWITTDPFHGGVQVTITGPLGFERSVQFAVDEDSVEITFPVRFWLVPKPITPEIPVIGEGSEQ